MALKQMEHLLIKKQKKNQKKKNEKFLSKAVKVAKELRCPIFHQKLNNGVNVEHDSNVEGKEESDVQTTFHEGSIH